MCLLSDSIHTLQSSNTLDNDKRKVSADVVVETILNF